MSQHASDAVSLRMLLGRIDGSAPAIQAAAAAMMKHYDKSAGVAVVEWRNCLHSCRRDQLMPLLYVANEVLQNSKRNRGNKFLEAFSPVLGQSIVYMVQQDASIVEKIRRTVKIWGDRRVLSIRFVNELLHGLDPFRDAGGAAVVAAATTTTSTTKSSNNNSSGSNSNSPPVTPKATNASGAATTPSSRTLPQHRPPSHHPSARVARHNTESEGFSPLIDESQESSVATLDASTDEITKIVNDAETATHNILDVVTINNGNNNNEEDDLDDNDDEDDFDFFLRDNSEGSGLDVQLDVDPTALLLQPSGGGGGGATTTSATTAATSVNQRWLKRRRSSMESGGSGASSQQQQQLQGAAASKRGSRATNGTKGRRRSRRRSLNFLSTNSLLELWNQVASLQQSFDYSLAMLSDITPEALGDIETGQDLEMLVGDSLLEQYRQVLRFQELVRQQRRSLHAIAQERFQLQKEAVRYLPWLEHALKQDLEDIAFCQELEQKLLLVRDIHGPARHARDDRLAEEEQKRAQAEELERQRKEEAERLQFLESALNKETEAKPGMVWNRATQEYQYLNTEESWRD